MKFGTKRSESGDRSLSRSYYSKYKGVSTSKYLMNDDEDDRLSNISEIFDPTDEKRFINVYN